MRRIAALVLLVAVLVFAALACAENADPPPPCIVTLTRFEDGSGRLDCLGGPPDVGRIDAETGRLRLSFAH
jgi:hypothetical protein